MYTSCNLVVVLLLLLLTELPAKPPGARAVLLLGLGLLVVNFT